jgi:protein-tyrosine phosphatase
MNESSPRARDSTAGSVATTFGAGWAKLEFRGVPLPDPFSVLVVCTANICRSPVAERLLQARFAGPAGSGEAAGVKISSAGVRALAGAPMDDLAAEALLQLGGSPEGFVARQLDERLMHEADLILTMTREHRAFAVTLVPQALRRTFTLREFCRLAAVVDTADLPQELPARLRELRERAAPLRGVTRPASAGDDDVIDPHRGPLEGYRRMARLVDDAVTGLVQRL